MHLYINNSLSNYSSTDKEDNHISIALVEFLFSINNNIIKW